MEIEKHTILVVEDDLLLSEAAYIKLSRAGFNVLSVTSAEQGLQHLNTNKVDFIWLDMYLPGMSGLDFLELIRKRIPSKEIPVMIVSACSSNEEIKRASELNIIDFVTKIDHSIKDIVGQVSIYFENKLKYQLE